ncbi:MAG: acetylornithine transaminase, partial [Deltaproteobacteria bacterium]
AALLETAEKHLLRTYRQPPLVLARGQGCRLWDTSGKQYLDLYAGIAVNALGHNHPGLVAAIAAQAGRLIHTANYFYNDRGVELAGEIARRTGLERVFLCNSGTEAIEGALKLVRRWHFGRNDKDRTDVVATINAFHGRTLGAVSLTGQPKYWEGFGAPIPGVSHVAYGDLDAMRRRVNDHTAAVFVEPVQGEGGVLPAPPGYLAGLRKLCDEVGALLVFDEIQTGVGRTGKFLACHHDGVLPDVVALAKGLGGGLPIGAFVVREIFADALPPGTHGTTFGGGPLAAAAGLAVMKAFDDEKILENVVARGEHLLARLHELVKKHPGVAVGARGRGLLCGLVLDPSIDTRAVLAALREGGVLVSQAGDRVVRFAPPLIVTDADIDEGIAVLDTVLAHAPRTAPPAASRA